MNPRCSVSKKSILLRPVGQAAAAAKPRVICTLGIGSTGTCVNSRAALRTPIYRSSSLGWLLALPVIASPDFVFAASLTDAAKACRPVFDLSSL